MVPMVQQTFWAAKCSPREKPSLETGDMAHLLIGWCRTVSLDYELGNMVDRAVNANNQLVLIMESSSYLAVVPQTT